MDLHSWEQDGLKWLLRVVLDFAGDILTKDEAPLVFVVICQR